ncbi:hypothetical protein ABW21_db0202840 [Orbilia brochopaga]|nr:hypothetical protein ABW21_db0202840 [Drechslerella brochopaga]
MVYRDQALALQALMSHTTNETLFNQFTELSQNELKNLAKLTLIGLKNLRNYSGRPATTVDTPPTTPVQSPATSPARGRPGSPGPSHQRVKAIREGTPAIPPSSTSTPDLYQIVNVIAKGLLGIKNTVPDLPDKALGRSSSFAADCKTRQEGYCAITSVEMDDIDETAHIFPHSSLNQNKDYTMITWLFIVIILGESLRDKLVKELFTESKGIHTPSNGMCMDVSLHRRYDTGLFVLVPVQWPFGETDCLEVRYVCHSDMDNMRILMTYLPLAPNEQVLLDEDRNLSRRRLEAPRQLQNGDIIRLYTKDPTGLPLPSPFLLFFHEYFWKVLGYSGLQGPRARYEGRPRDYGKSSRRQSFGTGPGSSPLKRGAVRRDEEEASDGSGKGKGIAKGGDGTSDVDYMSEDSEMDIEQEESQTFDDDLAIFDGPYALGDEPRGRSPIRRARAQELSDSADSGHLFTRTASPRTIALFREEVERFRESSRNMHGLSSDDDDDLASKPGAGDDDQFSDGS